MKNSVKFLILFVVLIISSGWKYNVSVEINSDGTVKEEIEKIYENVDQSTKTSLYDNTREYLPAYYSDTVGDEEEDIKIDGIEYYDYEIKESGNDLIIKYSYTYPLEKYLEARSIKSSFATSSIDIDKNEKNISFNMNSVLDKDSNVYPIVLFENNKDLDNLYISIKSDYQVISTNASNDNGNYYWDISRDDYNKKLVFIVNYGDNEIKEIETTSNIKVSDVTNVTNIINNNDQNDNNDDNNSSFNYIFVVFIVIIVLFCIVLGIKLVIDNIKNNQI